MKKSITLAGFLLIVLNQPHAMDSRLLASIFTDPYLDPVGQVILQHQVRSQEVLVIWLFRISGGK